MLICNASKWSVIFGQMLLKFHSISISLDTENHHKYVCRSLELHQFPWEVFSLRWDCSSCNTLAYSIFMILNNLWPCFHKAVKDMEGFPGKPNTRLSFRVKYSTEYLCIIISVLCWTVVGQHLPYWVLRQMIDDWGASTVMYCSNYTKSRVQLSKYLLTV